MGPSTAPDDPARPRPPRAARRPVRARNADANSATRIEILKSAAAAFRKLGYHGATVEQIASALRMKKGNLYYYFRNKEEILFACHQYSLDRLLALLEEVQQSDAGPEDKLRRLIVTFVHTILDELHGTALFLDLEALTPAHLKTVIVRQVIQQGVAYGSFGPVDAKLLSFAILGAVNWIPRWFDPAGPASSEQIGQLFADYLIGGLRSRSSDGS
jgi:AcrR family transcriptional regulator